jgi:hypothetical protein
VSKTLVYGTALPPPAIVVGAGYGSTNAATAVGNNNAQDNYAVRSFLYFEGSYFLLMFFVSLQNLPPMTRGYNPIPAQQ